MYKTVTETIRDIEQMFAAIGEAAHNATMKWPVSVSQLERARALMAERGLRWSLFAAGVLPALLIAWGWLERVL